MARISSNDLDVTPMVRVDLTLSVKVPLTWFDEENDKGKITKHRRDASEVAEAFKESEAWDPWASALHEFNVFSGDHPIVWTLEVNDT